MNDSGSPTTPPNILSEELAHRVLARAVELDVLAQSVMTVERLRVIANELGIPEPTFAAALAEVQRSAPAEPKGLLQRWLQRARGESATARPWGDALLANAAALAAFWAALGLVTTATRGAGLGWEFDTALRLIVGFGGVALARHMRARPVGFVLATASIAQLAEFVIHLVYGIKAAQGADTHFAVLLAAAIGVAVTTWGRRSPQAGTQVSPDGTADAAPTDPPHWSLIRSTARSVFASSRLASMINSWRMIWLAELPVTSLMLRDRWPALTPSSSA